MGLYENKFPLAMARKDQLIGPQGGSKQFPGLRF